MTTYESASETYAQETTEAIPASHTEAVETVISSLDQYDSALVNHTEEGYIWKFKYGSVDVLVQLTGLSDEDMFTVWSPVLQLPVSNQAQLMQKLLEMNWLATFESCFGIFNQQVVVLATRAVADLSPGEISRLITIVATIADDNDEALQGEFQPSK